MSLAVLDVSHNEITSLPVNLWVMPSLTTLNLSYNILTSLPFSSPLTPDSDPTGRTRDARGDWFSQAIERAVTPLPKLLSLDVSHNEIPAAGVDHEHLPAGLTKIDLSFNPLGNASVLVKALSRLVNLQEFRAELAAIADDSFPADILMTDASSVPPFSRLRLLDVGETQVTQPVIEAAFRPALVKQKLEFEITNEPPKDGVLRMIVGKKVVKEAWELEIERRTRLRNVRHTHTKSQQSNGSASAQETRAVSPVKEQWEVDADQMMLTDGAKRRAKAAAAAEATADLSLPSTSALVIPKKLQPAKEQWEVEAEQGLLTAGGRRRARAQAALAAAAASGALANASALPTPAASPTTATHPTSADALCHPKHYDASSNTLTLPASAPPSRALHSRSVSLAPKFPPSKSTSESTSESLAIPVPTLPLAAIISQSFADTLQALILSQRRMDPSFSLPTGQNGPFLPHLQELRLDNCNLNNHVPICAEGSNEDFSSARTSEPLLPTISKLFPSLKDLDLSYNNLTSAALTEDILSEIILASDEGASVRRAGLRQLHLRGNRITDVDSFQSVAKLFKGHKGKSDVDTFKLEELDLRDNEISKLAPELGLMPLDVLLVDGNVYV